MFDSDKVLNPMLDCGGCLTFFDIIKSTQKKGFIVDLMRYFQNFLGFGS